MRGLSRLPAHGTSEQLETLVKRHDVLALLGGNHCFPAVETEFGEPAQQSQRPALWCEITGRFFQGPHRRG